MWNKAWEGVDEGGTEKGTGWMSFFEGMGWC